MSVRNTQLSSSRSATAASRFRQIVLTSFGFGLVLALAACGGGSHSASGMAMPSGTSSGGAASAARNDADVKFIQGMYPHRSGAVAMAQLASSRAGSQQVKDLASKIAAAQTPEQQKMKDWAAAWGVSLDAHGMSSMPGMSSGSMPSGSASPGPGMDADVTALSALSGTAFDREFLTRMIAHHEGALPMAQAEVSGGSNPEAKKMAQEIITTQTAEIAQMKKMLAAL